MFVVDIAKVYGFGDSERVIGRWMATKARDSLVIATKVIRLPCHDNMFLQFLGSLIPCAFVLCFGFCLVLSRAGGSEIHAAKFRNHIVVFAALASACLSLLATQPLCGVTRVMICICRRVDQWVCSCCWRNRLTFAPPGLNCCALGYGLPC